MIFKKIKVETDYLTKNVINYNEYKFLFSEVIKAYFMGFIVLFVIGFIFYESIVLSTVTGFISGFIYIPIRRKQLIIKRKNILEIQFKELLESLGTSVGAGKNIPDSFLSSRVDLVVQFSEESYIVKELNIINIGIVNGFNIEALLKDLALRTNIADIINFSDVFDTCYRKGGNIKSVISKTNLVMRDKMSIQMDIKTMVTQKQTEQNILMVMPVVFVFLLRTMGGDMVDLNSPTGRLASTISIVIFTISFFISKKILDIKL